MEKKYILAPSILGANLARLEDEIHTVEACGADWIHIDAMDGHYVPNIAMGPAIVEACRKVTTLPLDVHFMLEKPDQFVDVYADAGASSITVHIEADRHIMRTMQSIRDRGLLVGVTLNPGTPAAALTEVLPMVDLVLVMTVNPGFYGQTFMESMLGKIRQIREMLDDVNPAARIEVDGGINADNAPRAAEAGAEIFIASKAVFKHPEGARVGMQTLRQALQPEKSRKK
jgi:ribulose-phosphate 3-epimerase